MTTVVNVKYDDYDIFIGRGGQWGNPFEIGVDGSREEVVDKYYEWILTQPHLLAQLYILKDKRLGCFCKPKLCHGDVLVYLVEEFFSNGKETELLVVQRLRCPFTVYYRGRA